MNNPKVQVLGLGCAKCKVLYQLVKDTVKEVNPAIEVEYVTDIERIMELKVMSMPVFAVNGKVISAGRTPKKDEIIEALNTL